MSRDLRASPNTIETRLYYFAISLLLSGRGSCSTCSCRVQCNRCIGIDRSRDYWRSRRKRFRFHFTNDALVRLDDTVKPDGRSGNGVLKAVHECVETGELDNVYYALSRVERNNYSLLNRRASSGRARSIG